MTDELGRLLVAVFAGEDAAERAREGLKKAEKGHAAAIQAMATIYRAEDGQLHIKETADPGGRRGALAGGLIGAVIGLLGGLGGAIVAAAAGALVGGLTARVIDSGIPDQSLSAIGQSLLPGHSALVVIVDESWRQQTESLLAGAGARVLTGSLISVIAEQLRLPGDPASDDNRAGG